MKGQNVEDRPHPAVHALVHLAMVTPALTDHEAFGPIIHGIMTRKDESNAASDLPASRLPIRVAGRRNGRQPGPRLVSTAIYI